MHISLRPDVEKRVREQLSSGVDANELMLMALDTMAEAEAVEVGWRQAEAGDFVQSDPDSVIRRADEQSR